MKEDEKIIEFKPVQHKEEEQEEQPRDLLKEFGSFENLPKGEEFNLDDIFNMFEDIQVYDKFLVFEHEGKGDHEHVYYADTEIKAFEIYKRFKHTDKSIYKSDVVYKDMMGSKILQSYELHERIK